MELESFVNGAADKHVVRSREDLKDTARCVTWTNGQRAKEQASEIVSTLVKEAIEAVEQGEEPNEG